MRDGKARPYLMGEQQRPNCVNCGKDELWSYFCQYQSHGPACPQYDQDTLFETLRSRSSLLWVIHARPDRQI